MKKLFITALISSLGLVNPAGATDLFEAINISASGMYAQNIRMKLAAENIANADSIVGEAGGPYRRKTVSFKAVTSKETGLTRVEPSKISRDTKTPLRKEYDPSNPLANAEGFVEMPNVNTMIESVDMREASRMYEANMAAIETAKLMMVRSLDLLR